MFMKQIRFSVKQVLKLIFSMTGFFILVNFLNTLNTTSGISEFWKLAGAVVVVLFIATLKIEDSPKTLPSTNNL